MGDEFVSIAEHNIYVVLESSRICSKMMQQTFPEVTGVRHDILPIVLSLSVGKEFAPFKHAHVDEASIRCAPETKSRIIFGIHQMQVLFAVSDAVVCEVSCERTAKHQDTAQSILSRHRRVIHNWNDRTSQRENVTLAASISPPKCPAHAYRSISDSSSVGNTLK
jgi:hypothetical protein